MRHTGRVIARHRFRQRFGSGLATIFDRHPGLRKGWTEERAFSHMGTLGTGNHFVELCLDEVG